MGEIKPKGLLGGIWNQWTWSESIEEILLVLKGTSDKQEVKNDSILCQMQDQARDAQSAGGHAEERQASNERRLPHLRHEDVQDRQIKERRTKDYGDTQRQNQEVRNTKAI